MCARRMALSAVASLMSPLLFIAVTLWLSASFSPVILNEGISQLWILLLLHNHDLLNSGVLKFLCVSPVSLTS